MNVIQKTTYPKEIFNYKILIAQNYPGFDLLRVILVLSNENDLDETASMYKEKYGHELWKHLEIIYSKTTKVTKKNKN